MYQQQWHYGTNWPKRPIEYGFKSETIIIDVTTKKGHANRAPYWYRQQTDGRRPPGDKETFRPEFHSQNTTSRVFHQRGATRRRTIFVGLRWWFYRRGITMLDLEHRGSSRVRSPVLSTTGIRRRSRTKRAVPRAHESRQSFHLLDLQGKHSDATASW